MGNYYAGMMNNTGGYGELKHHGILGQKWGVRRWQNADGSLTAAGRERYNKGTEKYLGKKDADAYRNADADTRAAVDKIVKKIKRDELVDAAKTAGVSALLGIGGGMGYNNATFGKREERLENDNKQIKELLYGNDKSSMDIPKTGMSKVSLRDRISNFYNGRTNGETDSTKVKDLTLRRQMENNQRNNVLLLQDKKQFGSDEAKEEKALTDKFIKTSVKEYENAQKADRRVWKDHGESAWKKSIQKTQSKATADIERYMREVAKIRLKSMGYDVTDKAVDNLVSKDWFKDSLWIRNTIASMGGKGVTHTIRDDYRP